jgi:uncharacterized protein (DUF1778 family)
MPQRPASREARLEARAAAAQEAEQRTITEVIRLSREAQERFAALLLCPPALAPALKKAFERHHALIVE